MYDLTFMYFLYYFLVHMCIRSNLSFVLNHERHYLKIYGVFHFSHIECYVILFVKLGYFYGSLPSNSNPYHKKDPAMLYTIGFEILSRL